LRVIDKLAKVGVDNVRAELDQGRIDDSGDPIRGVGLDGSVIDLILGFVSIRQDTRRRTVEAVADLLPESSASDSATEEMRALDSALNSLGVLECEAVFDPSLARGLDYYTGPVFEAFLPQAPSFGSVMGGGRYDRLVERFLDRNIPGTGVSIGLDRLLAGLAEIGKADYPLTTTKAIVLSMKGVSATETLLVAKELRDAGIPTDVYMGDPETTLREQFSYAGSLGIPIAIVMGPDEVQSGQVSVKDLLAGKEQRADIQDRSEYRKAGRVGQRSVPRGELVETVLSMIGSSSDA
jgi:histidyl-tRNA synthetase